MWNVKQFHLVKNELLLQKRVLLLQQERLFGLFWVHFGSHRSINPHNNPRNKSRVWIDCHKVHQIIFESGRKRWSGRRQTWKLTKPKSCIGAKRKIRVSSHFTDVGKREEFTYCCSELKKKFRETSLHLVVLNALISRNICDNQVRTHGMHAVHNVTWKNEKLSPIENISSNQLFSNFFSKNITFTKFLQKCAT